MFTVIQAYDTLAEVLTYPNARTRPCLAACRTALAQHTPEVATALDCFAQQIEGLSTEDLQELYSQTFDLNPICSLEVGWQLSGRTIAAASSWSR